ncbi:type I phosphomannose isomerase catalytic subunit [Muriicola jejuensis]|uniref:Phosphohexomutase n=1 Tax=Muriicola jejuensis TaxID=504488 RepID=A0A6P0UBB0_9FLAO|nr:type I phosphomannose isomerase catalytic subunit [Muriicola jejuensis]NER09179.1 mannose-6-phosphate isomerase [Muriicola jejuensis]
MYPLKFHPILKERLWGGTKLAEKLNKPITSDITGESWELSGVKEDVSRVANGDLKGTSLNELIDQWGERLLGRSVMERFGSEFPILIKFIDAKQDLSIQLHPHDELARSRHNSFGKTEMWYIMDADEDANLIVGFNQPMTREKYVRSLEDRTLLDYMNYERVKPGDTFFINTGKIHAIGAGVLLAEIQQTSDITYRVYDFDRRDKEGKLRELHTDLALDAIDFEKKDDFVVTYERKQDVVNPMVDCPYFKTQFLNLQKDLVRDTQSRDSFTIFMCVHGEAVIANENGSASLKKGETVLLPASSARIEIRTSGCELLEVTV